jgi:hypothetical protein
METYIIIFKKITNIIIMIKMKIKMNKIFSKIIIINSKNQNIIIRVSSMKIKLIPPIIIIMIIIT